MAARRRRRRRNPRPGRPLLAAAGGAVAGALAGKLLSRGCSHVDDDLVQYDACVRGDTTRSILSAAVGAVAGYWLLG